MFGKVLVANRGAIACRILRTLRAMNIRSVAVYSEADRHSLHVRQADEAVLLGPSPAAQSYLSFDALFAAVKQTGAEAIHPGYGFLSENAAFARACEANGVVFIGPTPSQMEAFGLKHTARALATKLGVPLLPGTDLLADIEDAVKAGARIGYPVMLKSSAGGGGIGMRLCRSETDLREAFDAVQRLSQANFGNAGVFLEKFVEQARHIEVQIFGDGRGGVLSLGERDCSVQRRNQKIIEETPAPGLPDHVRGALAEAAVALGKSVAYESAGTVEFIYDNASKEFYFLEVNTRLQVEHGVTEEVTGIDLVAWMVRQAARELGDLEALKPKHEGHSIQVRLYAEDPAKNFQPGAGLLSHVQFSPDVRVETAVESGTEISPFYDSMIAKIIVHGRDRVCALRAMRSALSATSVSGIETNLAYLRQICASQRFAEGGVTTNFVNQEPYVRAAIEVLEPGTQTTIQDYPGRLGYWHVGVPPSGPMDSLAFRMANRLVGNYKDAPGLEMAVSGISLRFETDTVIALCGADMGATLDGSPVPLWSAVSVAKGSVLQMGVVEGPGARAYLAVRGGFAVPEYLKSRSTFILGKFGGHAGRVLRAGDVLHIGSFLKGNPAVSTLRPSYPDAWQIGVLYGPHGAPDFFTERDIETFFSTDWKVHYNSDRTGVRLIGPKPEWARKDGGEAGLHPSNLHDNAYAVGTVDFTGDMPVLLGPDGPSLGGFVCPASIVQAELWKMGQLRPGDVVQFRAVTQAQAEAMERALESSLATLSTPLPVLPENAHAESPLLRNRAADGDAPALVCRADSDKYLLIEYGPNVLDFHLRFRVHALQERLRASGLPGIIDVTPGIRSLQIHYNNFMLRREDLLAAVDDAEASLKKLPDVRVASRVVHLPLSWEDPQTLLAIHKYMQSVRPDAPWCPSNIEFIRRINGLGSVDDVHRIVFDASYLVLGLGDVYLGAPVATPVDPRHRLVTTKYNPARTWTPENAVGIGGAYLCVYGMEGPGGYQFVGRTVQMWNTYRSTPNFEPGTPWLLRFFDQIRFYPVSADELVEQREAFPYGKFAVRTEDTTFSLAEYDRFLASISGEAVSAKARQQQAFEEERERWVAAGLQDYSSEVAEVAPVTGDGVIPSGCSAVRSPVTANVWSVGVEPGQRVEAGDRLLVLEAMKMEVAVAAPRAGIVEELRCAPGTMVHAGQSLLVLRFAEAAP
ncbi:MAG: urea carboxylase [Bryobacteraceae bacterium]|nr:urea carboxylase [Bryobacteraceae bacterium]